MKASMIFFLLATTAAGCGVSPRYAHIDGSACAVTQSLADQPIPRPLFLEKLVDNRPNKAVVGKVGVQPIFIEQDVADSISRAIANSLRTAGVDTRYGPEAAQGAKGRMYGTIDAIGIALHQRANIDYSDCVATVAITLHIEAGQTDRYLGRIMGKSTGVATYGQEGPAFTDALNRAMAQCVNILIARLRTSETASTPGSPPQTKATEDPQGLLTIQSFRLLQAYQDNEIRADADFKDKRFAVKGRVKGVGKDPDGSPYVLVGSDPIFGAQCFFSDESHIKALAELNAGDYVTIVGTGAGAGKFGNVLMTDCAVYYRHAGE